MIDHIITEYRPEHYRTERQQSRTMQEQEWENRVKPLVSYATELLRLVGIVVMGCCLAYALGVM
jgi:hypothetical protein